MTDPYKGAKKEGGIGFVKGVGRGIMSVPFRVMGGAWSVPGYAMKGLYQEMIKSKGKSVQNYIIAARIAQGYDEASSVSQQEVDDIVARWKYVKVGIKKKRNPGAEQMDSLHSLVDEQRKRKTDRWERVNSAFKKPESRPSFPPDTSPPGSYNDAPHGGAEVENEIRSTIPSWRQQEAERVRSLRRQTTHDTAPLSTSTTRSNVELEAQLIAEEEAEQRELEKAIAASVAEASRGDPDEDKLIANAIRASIAELESAPVGASEEDDEAALKRAITASIEEAGKGNVTAEEQKALEDTLRKSVLDTSKRRQHGSDSEWGSDDDTEDDEELQRIITESKKLAHLHEANPQDFQNSPEGAKQESGMIDAMSQAIGAAQKDEHAARGGHSGRDDDDDELKKALQESETQKDKHVARGDDDNDEELKKALQESEKAEKERVQNLDKQRTEEDIVMEYVQKQSLLEEQHRQRVAQGWDTAGEGSGSGTK